MKNKIWKWTFVAFAVFCLSFTGMAQKGSVKKRSKPQSKNVTSPKPTKSTITVEQIVAPFLLPADSPDREPVWSAIDELAGIKWRDKTHIKIDPRDTDYIRSGTINLLGRGTADVTFTGSEATVSGIDIFLVTGNGGEIFFWDEYSKVLREQFGPRTLIRLLRGKCEEDSRYYSAVYEIVLEGRKPMYALLSSDDSPSRPAFHNSSFSFSRRSDEEYWKCTSD